MVSGFESNMNNTRKVDGGYSWLIQVDTGWYKCVYSCVKNANGGV